MRTTNYMLSTIKEFPRDVEAISHMLMLRAGMIRTLTSGIYIWLPTGLRVLKNIENIIREEMNSIGLIEIQMPIINPDFLWKQSGRWFSYGQELIKFNDRNNKSFILSPTNEELITYLINNEIISYKELPISFYQINTKFRDELRTRSGVIRCKEFIMKDAYSFHIDQKSLQEFYYFIHKTYYNIFKKIQLNFYVVQADNSNMGGHISHEFHVLSNSGEDEIVFSKQSNYAANIDIAEAKESHKKTILQPKESIKLIDVSHIKNNIYELIKYYKISIKKIIKVIIVHANIHNSTSPYIALILRYDHEINRKKIEKLAKIAVPLKFANDEEIKNIINIDSYFLGPINLPLPIIIDNSVSIMSDFVSGANINGKYYFGINWKRDLPIPETADLRKITEEDIIPDGSDGVLNIKKSIEVGHIFQLGCKYSDVMKARIQGRNNIQSIYMGCYGIGITRIIAAIIEQHHDDKGIIWPDIIAPFKVAIIPINMHKSLYVYNIAEKIYNILKEANISVLFDNRKKKSISSMFSDIYLIGIPHILVINEKNLKINKVEYLCRKTLIKKVININEILNYFS